MHTCACVRPGTGSPLTPNIRSPCPSHECLPKSHRYRVAASGYRIAPVCCGIHWHTLTPTLAAVFDESMPTKLGRAIRSVEEQIGRLWTSRPLSA